MEFFIREVAGKDIAAITRLSNQLGYSLSETDTLQNLEAISLSSETAVFVAIHEEKVIGWIHVFKTVRVESGLFAEIGGLVVDDRYQGKGAGKMLVQEVQKWCSRQNISSLRVRCNIKRAEAHEFYTTLGFRENKQQKVFEILLDKK